MCIRPSNNIPGCTILHFQDIQFLETSNLIFRLDHLLYYTFIILFDTSLLQLLLRELSTLPVIYLRIFIEKAVLANQIDNFQLFAINITISDEIKLPFINYDLFDIWTICTKCMFEKLVQVEITKFFCFSFVSNLQTT